MSLAALGASQLSPPAGSSAGGAAGTAYNWGSAAYSGLLCPAKYDIILGTAGPFNAGTQAVALSTVNIPSVAAAAACIVEAWLVLPAVPAAAGATTIGAKYCGIVTFTAGNPSTAILTLNAVDGTGAIANFTGSVNFRVYVPRAGYY